MATGTLSMSSRFCYSFCVRQTEELFDKLDIDEETRAEIQELEQYASFHEDMHWKFDYVRAIHIAVYCKVTKRRVGRSFVVQCGAIGAWRIGCEVI